MRRQVFTKVSEFVREEAKFAVPAATRAARHAGAIFLQKFTEEYRRERRKKR